MKAFAMGNLYESKLVKCLADINEKSNKLKDEATKSHIHGSHTGRTNNFT